MKIRNIAFHRIKAALALGAGIALLAPAASPYSLKQKLQYSSRKIWMMKPGRLLDDTMEYEEIPNLIEFFNTAYRSAADSVEDGLKDSYDLVEKMREDGKEYRQQAKGLEAEGDMIYSAQYKAMAKSLSSAASTMEKTLDKQARRLDQNTLAPIRYQLSSAVQSLFIGYKQMEVNREMLEKMVQLYSSMLSMSDTAKPDWDGNLYGSLSAKVSLTLAQNQLQTLDNSMDSMRGGP